jgi:hypothetical protein
MDLRIIDKFLLSTMAEYSSLQSPCHSIRLEQVAVRPGERSQEYSQGDGERLCRAYSIQREIGLVWIAIGKESSSGAQVPRGGTIADGQMKSTSTRNGESVPF